MTAGDVTLLAPVPASADDAQLLCRLSKLRVALRLADHAAISKDNKIRYLLEQLAAAETMQRGTPSEAEVADRITPAMAGEKEQLDSADGDADAVLRLELIDAKAVLEDERQVHAEERQRLAVEAAVARARASGAARSDLAAAAARAAEQAGREAMVRSQREAAEMYDRWRLRTEAAEQQASALQWHADQARAAEREAAAQQRLQAAALDSCTEQLHEARKLAAWQERRIAYLEGSNAYQSIARLSAQLEAVQQRAAATEAALHAELAALRFQMTRQSDHCRKTPSAAGDVKAEPLCNQMQLGVPVIIPGMCCEDDTAQAVSDDIADPDCEPISALLEALDGKYCSADSETLPMMQQSL